MPMYVSEEDSPPDMKLIIGLSVTVGILAISLPLAIIFVYRRAKNQREVLEREMIQRS